MRFELTDPFESLVFKTSAIDHSTTLPYRNTPRSQTPAVNRTNLFGTDVFLYGRGYQIRTDDDDFKDRCLRPLGETPTKTTTNF